MGIDARIIAVRDHPHLTETEVKKLSYQLGATLGPEKFFLRHPDMGDDGPFQTAITIEPPDEVQKHHHVYYQDGPDFCLRPDQQFLEVNLRSRYFGIDYERGDFPSIFFIAEWLSVNIPFAEVFYGGDSSGVCFRPWVEVRDNLLRHYLTFGRLPYQLFFGPQTVICDFCTAPMAYVGGGGSKDYFRCPGCGRKVIREGEQISTLTYNSDFFNPEIIS